VDRARNSWSVVVRVGTVVLGEHPDRGALEDHQPSGDLRHLGDQLDRARGAADHGNPLAAEVESVGPTRGMDGLSGERLATRDVGPHGHVEHAEGTDEDVHLEVATVVGTHPPGACGLVPRRLGDLGVQGDVRHDPVLLGATLEVGEDLRLGRVAL
jgi:hypothetical protein